MRSQINDGVCNELARAVEGSLATAQGFDKLCGSIVVQVGLLLGRDCADFAASAGVDWIELAGYYVWGRGGKGGGWFGGEEAGDEGFLEEGGGAVGYGIAKVEVEEGTHCVG